MWKISDTNRDTCIVKINKRQVRNSVNTVGMGCYMVTTLLCKHAPIVLLRLWTTPISVVNSLLIGQYKN